jgi:hypothetical protein
MIKLRISHISKEGVLEGSKWISYQVLLDGLEMQDLFKHLMPCFLINVSQVITNQSGIFLLEDFFKLYHQYTETLAVTPEMRPFFSAHVTSSLDTHYAMEVKENTYLIKPLLPSLQLKICSFHFERETQKFHTMCFGKKEISWGLEFSYPALYRDPKTREIVQTLRSNTCNLSLFKKAVAWIRQHTRPTPLLIDGKKIIAPFRIGRYRPDLRYHGIEIV